MIRLPSNIALPVPGSKRDISDALVALVRQFGKYLVVGVSNTVVAFVSYAILISMHMLYWPAGALAYGLGAVNGYILNRIWTFSAPDSRDARIRYAVVQTTGLAMTVASLWLLVSEAHLNRIVGYAVATPLVTVGTFLANWGWTFQTAEKGSNTRGTR
jgi:putative flippase GtrA